MAHIPPPSALHSQDNTFTFLRFFFATLVFFSHSFTLYGVGNDPVGMLSHDLNAGLIALYGFFFISGHLVSGSWFSDPHVGRFLTRRALRIFPGLMAAVIGIACIVGPLLTHAPDYWSSPLVKKYFLNIFLFPKLYFQLPGVATENPFPLNINEPFYTLPYEVIAYGALAFLGHVGGLRFRVIFPLAIFALGMRIWNYDIVGIQGINFTDPSRGLQLRYLGTLGLYFLIGILYTLVSRVVTRYPFWFPACLPISLVVMLLSFESPIDFYIVLLCLPLAIIAASKLPVRWMRKWEKYGDLSYGIYLWGFPIQQALMALWGDSLTFLTFNVFSYGITLVIAAISWLCIERIALKLKPQIPAKPSAPTSFYV